jgi:flagellar basal-body rod protein FlgB
VSNISDSSTIDALRRQMAIAVARQVASAGNLANVDTPGYKTKEVNFADTLKNKLGPGGGVAAVPGAPNPGAGSTGRISGLHRLPDDAYRPIARDNDVWRPIARDHDVWRPIGNETYPRTGNGGVVLQEVDGLPARRDGNNVQLDRELLSMSRAAGDFSAAQTALAAKFRLVRYAINEGR